MDGLKLNAHGSVCVVYGAGDGAGDDGDESGTRDDESSGRAWTVGGKVYECTSVRV